MRFKFKYTLFLPLVALCSSCSFSTKTEYTDYLVNKYELKNVVNYNEELMTEHSYINTSGLQIYNGYFVLNRCSIAFNYGNSKDKITFDFSLKENSDRNIIIEKVGYKYFTLDNISKIVTDYSGDDFEFYEITVFPNYWLRIRTHYMIEEETKELIFEYKSIGKNV